MIGVVLWRLDPVDVGAALCSCCDVGFEEFFNKRRLKAWVAKYT